MDVREMKKDTAVQVSDITMLQNDTGAGATTVLPRFLRQQKARKTGLYKLK